eukprot:1211212-Pleurochrysis_carterae.AAC.1
MNREAQTARSQPKPLESARAGVIARERALVPLKANMKRAHFPGVTAARARRCVRGCAICLRVRNALPAPQTQPAFAPGGAAACATHAYLRACVYERAS